MSDERLVQEIDSLNTNIDFDQQDGTERRNDNNEEPNRVFVLLENIRVLCKSS
jgi:hypothetical protein